MTVGITGNAGEWLQIVHSDFPRENKIASGRTENQRPVINSAFSMVALINKSEFHDEK